MGYLRNWVGVCEGITVRADCANKRGIYKWKWVICETEWVGAGIMGRADCANKRGIYKLVWEVCETGCMCAGIMVRADCANKRRIYKLGWEVCESGCVGWEKIMACICLFLEKTEHSILYQFF